MSLTAAQIADIVKEYQTKPGDTGSTQVQVAVLTAKIAYLTDHIKEHKHDFHSRRGLLRMVSQRRSLLDYMKRKNIEQYRELIKRLGYVVNSFNHQGYRLMNSPEIKEILVSSTSKTFQYGEHSVTLETGKIARQATGSVVLKSGNMVLLATVVGKKTAKEGIDFFPLTVNYQEKAYAAGKIPGSYFKREGRPGEHETLIARLIDRPLRPLFPEGFKNEVQIVITVLSYDNDIGTDVMSIIASSAALAISGIPFAGPVAAARVGYKDGNYLLNPGKATLEDSQLNLVVAKHKLLY